MAETSSTATFWTSRRQAAVAVLAVIVVAGLVLAMINITRDPTPGPPASPSPQPSRTSTFACPEMVTGTGTLTSAPPTTWTLVGRMAAPEVAGAGPAVTDSDGWRHCWAQSPTGALVAAANYMAMTDVSELHGRLAADGLMPGAARDRLMSTPETSGTKGDPMQVRGFRLVSFSPEVAEVDLAVEMRGTYAAMMITLHWYQGDWRLGVRGEGDAQELDIDYSYPPSLYGYIPWAGA